VPLYLTADEIWVFGWILQRRLPGMALTKAQIIENIVNEIGFTKRQATDTIENLLKIIKQTLASGEDVLVSGFGKFNVKSKNQRRGRNPATGDDLMLDARRVVTFKCSGKLRDKINGGE
jgi:integration host factor subunit alpha